MPENKDERLTPGALLENPFEFKPKNDSVSSFSSSLRENPSLSSLFSDNKCEIKNEYLPVDRLNSNPLHENKHEPLTLAHYLETHLNLNVKMILVPYLKMKTNLSGYLILETQMIIRQLIL